MLESKLEKIVLWLSKCSFITYKKQLQIVNNFNLIDLVDNFNDIKLDLIKLLGLENCNLLENSYNENEINNYISNLEQLNIGVITIYSKDYPENLKNIIEFPLVLYYKGNISLLKTDCLAIVGSRRTSRYGVDVTKLFAGEIAKRGITIVSGLADGVDTLSHTEALNVKGNTIAVLGSGVNEIYPANNTNLAKKIIENNGLIISEYKPNEKPQTYYFPIRNRIIAALSKAVLITEATEKSGSMYTKNYALEYGKEVFAIPGRISDIYSVGCNKIIKNCQSAIALSPLDVLEFYGKSYVETNKQNIQLTLNDELILKIIDVNELHYEEILLKSKLDSKTLNTTLMRLEIKGLIKKLNGNYYSR